MPATPIIFSNEIKIPKEGCTLLVRDNVIYHTWGDKDTFYPICESGNGGGIRSNSLKPTDKIYQFPDNTIAYRTLSGGNCLDKFLLKSDANDGSVATEIWKRLKEGKIIGVEVAGNGRWHLLNEEYSASLRNPKCNSINKKDRHTSLEKKHEYCEFSDIYELGAWIAKNLPLA